MTENNINLSKRQKRIADRLQDGESRKMVAANENISVNTVHMHCRNMYRMFGVHNLASFLNRIRGKIK